MEEERIGPGKHDEFHAMLDRLGKVYRGEGAEAVIPGVNSSVIPDGDEPTVIPNGAARRIRVGYREFISETRVPPRQARSGPGPRTANRASLFEELHSAVKHLLWNGFQCYTCMAGGASMLAIRLDENSRRVLTTWRERRAGQRHGMLAKLSKLISTTWRTPHLLRQLMKSIFSTAAPLPPLMK